MLEYNMHNKACCIIYVVIFYLCFVVSCDACFFSILYSVCLIHPASLIFCYYIIYYGMSAVIPSYKAPNIIVEKLAKS